MPFEKALVCQKIEIIDRIEIRVSIFMEDSCKNCGKNYEVSEKEAEFCKRMDVPLPQDCKDCRQQRRLSFRNEIKLYKRNCDLCKKNIVSIYSPDKPYKVICPECWYGDGYDGLECGRRFDFERPFFEQFDELLHEAYLMSLFGGRSENSDYVNQETDDKNCYMNAGGHYNEDCYYNTYCIWGKNNLDNYWLMRSELCYECIKCENCFNSDYLQNCENCSDCHYCFDLKSCDNCFGCIGLRHKKFHFFNQQLEENEYHQKVSEYLKDSSSRQKALEDCQKHFLKFPHKYAQIVNCQNCVGDDLLNSKNVENGFLVEKCEDCGNIFIGLGLKDCCDINSIGWSELLYNCASSGEINRGISLSSVWEMNDSYYCFCCRNGSDLFGCVGLNRQRYCILNKKYTREEYEQLLPKIIEHMKKTGEWGLFFPPQISPWGYNETVAQEYFPLNKEQALLKGYKWKDKENKDYLPQSHKGSYEIEDVDESICQEVLSCQNCGKNYKVIAPELKFYQKHRLPIPKFCLDCRREKRLQRKVERTLFDRKCAKCGIEIKSSYNENRPEIVYCEDCYLKEIS